MRSPVAVLSSLGLAMLIASALAASGTSTAAVKSAPGPYTAAQAATGSKQYAENCSRCHGAQLQGISAPALRGAGSGLAGDSIHDAYGFISTQMPAGAPGSLTTDQYVNITAFILSRNGHTPGKVKLNATLAKASKVKIS